VQIVLQKKESDTYEYLKKIMDNVTPLYQERLNHLPAQMRKTILEMAFIWEACTTKQLVERIRMESKLISANLTTLVEKGVVDKIETGKKQHLYRISERFFNMWLIITQGNPEQKRKAKWLSIFLESWYNEHDFKTLSGSHIEKLKSRNVKENDFLLYSKALSQSKYITLEERDTIIMLTKEVSKTKTDDKLIILPDLSEIITSKIIQLINDEQYKKAIACINDIENEADGIKFGFLGICYDKLNDFSKAKKYYLLAIEKGDIVATYNLALMYQNNEQLDIAEEYYLQAIDKGVNESYTNLAVLLKNQGKHDEAEKYYLFAIEKGFVGALNDLALLYFNQEKYNDAEIFLLLAIKKGYVRALFNLALLYENQEKYIEAEKYYLLAVEKGDVGAFFNLALLYKSQEKYTEAEKYYLLAIEKGDVEALNNLALLYENQAKYTEAEKYYLLAIEKGDVGALNNLALLYENQEKYIEAEKYYLLAIEKGDVGALNNLALLFKNQEKYIEAEKYFLLAIERDCVEAFNNLALLYYFNNKHKSKAFELINKARGIDPFYILREPEIIIEIWNGIFKDVENRVVAIIKEMKYEKIEGLIHELLIQQQKNLVLSLFHHPEIGKILQDKYMVLYYVTLIIKNQLENNLMLRIPPELEGTIEDVIQKIKNRQAVYGYN